MVFRNMGCSSILFRDIVIFGTLMKGHGIFSRNLGYGI